MTLPKDTFCEIPSLKTLPLFILCPGNQENSARYSIFKKLSHILDVNSMCAGLIGATMATPADVIKTRVMNQPTDERGRYVCISPIEKRQELKNQS